ncbi:MAG: DNA cytosine methyltransferase, partial [archaeon]|nr:DNA cytosine methyltransferase [archaeon]
PDNFEFVGAPSNSYKQIGNAVPPVLSWHVAKSIEKYFKGENKVGLNKWNKEKETQKLLQR